MFLLESFVTNSYMEEDPMYLLGFNLLRVYKYHSLYMKVDFHKEMVGFMIQERRELEEQLSYSFVGKILLTEK